MYDILKHMLKKIRAYLELMRPANIVTAFADILAGFAVAGGVVRLTGGSLVITPDGLTWLLISTFGLYGGGVVFNDVFDAKLDSIERPERAIPSGRASKLEASVLGTFLHTLGVLAAFQVNTSAGILAAAIVICTFLYDAKAKHSVVWGPIFMGLCRGGNLLLGCSIIPGMLPDIWFIVFIPIVYIAAITLISQGEVSGGSAIHGYIALTMLSVVTGGLVLFFLFPGYSLISALPFLILFFGLVFPPFLTAARKPEATTIKKAVKRGVVSLVILNSVIVAGFLGFVLGLVVFGLFLLSIGLSKVFAVT